MSEYIEVSYLHNRHDYNLTFGLYSTAKKCHSRRSHPAKHGEDL